MRNGLQQDLDSEDSPEDVDIRPGKPVTLDAVLIFHENRKGKLTC
jgi:hypothetical protein